MIKPKHKGLKTSLGVGIGVAALVAAAGVYFFGKEGKSHRQKIKGLSEKVKTEVLKQLKSVEHVSEDVYQGIVDQVLATYRGVKNIDVNELQKLGTELKSHWNNIKKDVESGMRLPRNASKNKKVSK